MHCVQTDRRTKLSLSKRQFFLRGRATTEILRIEPGGGVSFAFPIN